MCQVLSHSMLILCVYSLLLLCFILVLFLFLRLDSVTPYRAKDEEYDYYLNVCGKIASDVCKADPFVSSCQVKSQQHQQKAAGRFANQTLRCVRNSSKLFSNVYLLDIKPHTHSGCGSAIKSQPILPDASSTSATIVLQ